MRNKTNHKKLIILGLIVFNLISILRFYEIRLPVLIDIFTDQTLDLLPTLISISSFFFVLGIPFLTINLFSYFLIKNIEKQYSVSAKSIESILKSEDTAMYVKEVGDFKVEDLEYLLDRVRVECPNCGAAHSAIPSDTIKCGNHQFIVPEINNQENYNQYGVLIGTIFK